jgi:hypothetical protein
MNSIYKAVTMLFLAIILPAQAELTVLEDNHLGDIYGQAIFEITNQDVVQPGGDSLEMIKLTVGARIELNANIEEIALGRYWRPDGTNCSGGNGDQGGSPICYNNGTNPTPNTQNLKWACTSYPCGNVDRPEGAYISSSLTHGKEESFNSYPGGFEPDNGVDIKLRDVTMGRVMWSGGKRYLEPFVQENPYIELAFDENASGIRQLAGFRIGSEDSYGVQGNIIDVISGFVEPNITATIIGIDIDIVASLGGVRTLGWLAEDKLDLGDLLNGILVDLSPTAQLFPVQGNHLNHTGAFFLSANSKPIQWAGITGSPAPSVTAPGFWLNMGGDGRLIAKTQDGDHPNNYFPGHSKYQTYQNSTNYGRSVPTFSETYQQQ